VTPSDRAAAQAALGEGRAVYGRLDQIRGPEDAAADIMELWSAAESAMRAMLGGSTLSGQALVRELRQRGTLNLEQANALASFWDARSRTDDVAYKPTLTDVGFARAGYNELGRAIAETGAAATATASVGSGVPPSTFAPGGMPSAARPALVPPEPSLSAPTEPAPRSISPRRTSKPVLIAAAVIALIVIAAAVAYSTMGGSKFDRQMADGVSLMTTGRTEAARSAFGAIAHEYPDKAQPHVFLSRLARSDSPPDMNTARQELITAIRLEPGYAPAQREMGILQLADHNPSLARNFLIRAVQLAPNDSAAQGYLGCALMGLNRVAEAQKFLSRAGTGTWSSCATLPPTARAPITP
jgi:tetratricopeptide (TPR) repeat protein